MILLMTITYILNRHTVFIKMGMKTLLIYKTNVLIMYIYLLHETYIRNYIIFEFFNNNILFYQ